MNNTMEIRAPGMAGKSGTYDQQGIWLDVPWNDIGRGIDGSTFELDTHNFPNFSAASSNPTIAAASAINPLGHAVYYDTADVIGKAADEPFGAAKLVGAATDNNEQWVQAGGNLGGMIVLNAPSAATLPNVAFDACFQTSTIAANVRSLFIGCGEEGLAAANTQVDDTGAMADKDWIGFRTLHGAAAENATLQFAFKKAGQTLVTVIAALKTLVADTIYRVGFTHLPGVHPETRRITVWLDNVRQLVGVTNAQMAAATFPAGEEMAPLFGGKAGAATASTIKIHRVKAAMWKNP